MDIFQTISTGATIIYKFIDSYASASDQWRSLATRLKWDLRVIGQFTQYYEKCIKGDGSLSPEDAELLDSSAVYLSGLAARITSIAQRLESKSRFRRELNKALWWHREDEVRELEEELFEWTTRLDLRLVGLPSGLKTAIKLDNQATSNTPNFAASRHIESLKAMTEKAGQAVVANNIFHEDVDDFIKSIDPKNHERFQAIGDAGRQVLVERQFHRHPKDSAEWKELKAGLVRLASALNCLDGTTVSLLRCNYLFEDSRDPLAPNFSLVNSVPFPVTSKCPVLKSLITRTQGRVRLPANHSLSERYGLAQSLATAVFFLHSVGFLHHNVTSHNVLMLYRLGAPSQKQFPYSLGTPFLVGFEEVKEFHTVSDQREASDPDILYQHPDRLFETGRPKYGPEHDIYSLGMVMLEVGIWRPLERYTADLLDLEKRGTTISELIRLVDVSMGARFRKVLEWCLNLETSSQVDPIRLSREVLEPLEEMASSLR
ncbi:Protein kinase domain-containing protein [Fusarium sp. LHS14.1]|nr:Protein kinase domain-containing protein [Fusarium sp. LHS14.1]